jgi:hypothetical protein
MKGVKFHRTWALWEGQTECKEKLLAVEVTEAASGYGILQRVLVTPKAWFAVMALAPGKADRDQKERGLLHALLMNAAASLRIGSQLAVLPGPHNGEVLLRLANTEDGDILISLAE